MEISPLLLIITIVHILNSITEKGSSPQLAGHSLFLTRGARKGGRERGDSDREGLHLLLILKVDICHLFWYLTTFHYKVITGTVDAPINCVTFPASGNWPILLFPLWPAGSVVWGICMFFKGIKQSRRCWDWTSALPPLPVSRVLSPDKSYDHPSAHTPTSPSSFLGYPLSQNDPWLFQDNLALFRADSSTRQNPNRLWVINVFQFHETVIISSKILTQSDYSNNDYVPMNLVGSVCVFLKLYCVDYAIPVVPLFFSPLFPPLPGTLFPPASPSLSLCQ